MQEAVRRGVAHAKNGSYEDAHASYRHGCLCLEVPAAIVWLPLHLCLSCYAVHEQSCMLASLGECIAAPSIGDCPRDKQRIACIKQEVSCHHANKHKWLKVLLQASAGARQEKCGCLGGQRCCTRQQAPL